MMATARLTTALQKSVDDVMDTMSMFYYGLNMAHETVKGAFTSMSLFCPC